MNGSVPRPVRAGHNVFLFPPLASHPIPRWRRLAYWKARYGQLSNRVQCAVIAGSVYEKSMGRMGLYPQVKALGQENILLENSIDGLGSPIDRSKRNSGMPMGAANEMVLAPWLHNPTYSDNALIHKHIISSWPRILNWWPDGPFFSGSRSLDDWFRKSVTTIPICSHEILDLRIVSPNPRPKEFHPAPHLIEFDTPNLQNFCVLLQRKSFLPEPLLIPDLFEGDSGDGPVLSLLKVLPNFVMMWIVLKSSLIAFEDTVTPFISPWAKICFCGDMRG